MPNIIHIYVKQCEIMQKKLMKTLKRPNSLFLQCEINSVVLKQGKTRKTEETKRKLLKFFKCHTLSGAYHVKADVLTFPKIW